MLVLSRKLGEKVIVRTPSGEKIEVKVTEIDRNKVRLSFNGPRSLEVNREEIDRTIHPDDYAVKSQTGDSNAADRTENGKLQKAQGGPDQANLSRH